MVLPVIESTARRCAMNGKAEQIHCVTGRLAEHALRQMLDQLSCADGLSLLAGGTADIGRGPDVTAVD